MIDVQRDVPSTMLYMQIPRIGRNVRAPVAADAGGAKKVIFKLSGT
jgi:hypothetical protein